MNNILVTGGAGFLGSNLCERLLEDANNFVICLDNFYTGNEENIRKLYDNRNFKFIKADIVSVCDFDIKLHQIYNAACPASPIHYQKSPTYSTKTNVVGIINLLELAKKHQATLLQFSTSEIYGEPLTHPQIESYWGNINPNGIRSC